MQHIHTRTYTHTHMYTHIQLYVNQHQTNILLVNMHSAIIPNIRSMKKELIDPLASTPHNES